MSDELTDAQLVDLLKADRTAGFDLLYRRYAQRLFAYSVTVVRDRAAAEDATHESLMAAVAKIDKLRNPDQLRSWLFAITRNRCLTMATERNRFTDAEGVLDMIPVDEDPTAGVARDDSAALVAEALAGLAPADRDTLALALRHDLDMADVALAMGSNQPTARARISRAKAALTGSVTALLLARDAGETSTCDGLAQALAGFTGEWTPLIRKRVAKHVKACPECHEKGHERAVGYVSAFMLPVVLVLGTQARARADEGLATLDADGAGDWLTWRPDGFPEAVGRNSRRVGRGLAMAGVAGVALLLTAMVAWQVNAEPPPNEPAVAPVTSTPSPAPSATPSPQSTAARKQSAAPEKDPKASEKDNTATSQPTTQAEPEPEQSTTPDKGDEPSKDPRTSDPEPKPEPTTNTEPTEPTEPTKEPAPDPPKDPDPIKEPEPQPQPVEPEPKPDRPVTNPEVKDTAPSPDPPAAG